MHDDIFIFKYNLKNKMINLRLNPQIIINILVLMFLFHFNFLMYSIFILIKSAFRLKKQILYFHFLNLPNP